MCVFYLDQCQIFLFNAVYNSVEHQQKKESALVLMTVSLKLDSKQ
jgi:hypothetical protein